MNHFRIKNTKLRFLRKMRRLVYSMMTFWKILHICLIVNSSSGHATDDTVTYINSEKKNIHIRQGKKQKLYNLWYTIIIVVNLIFTNYYR